MLQVCFNFYPDDPCVHRSYRYLRTQVLGLVVYVEAYDIVTT